MHYSQVTKQVLMNNQIIFYKVTSPWVCSSLIGDPVFSALVSTEPLWDYELWQVRGPHMQYWQKILTFNRNLVQWMDCFSNSSSACRLLFVLLLFLLTSPFLSPFCSLCFVWGCHFSCLSISLVISTSFYLFLSFYPSLFLALFFLNRLWAGFLSAD